MTHLVDTSVWHKLGRSANIASAIFELKSAGALFTTCPPVVAEYCFSARNAAELDELREDMRNLHLLGAPVDNDIVGRIQVALWSTGRARAAGAIDTIIAAYAISARQVIVSADKDFGHISAALDDFGSKSRLRSIYLPE